MNQTIVCAQCGETATRTGPVQKYCASCSTLRDSERKRKWARKNPQPNSYTSKMSSARKELVVEAGKARSLGASILWSAEIEAPQLIWTTRICVPFTYAASKNHIYSFDYKGHLNKRSESSEMRKAIADALRDSIARSKTEVVQNKLYLDILVEKPNHRGDAMNVVDLVSDAVQDATSLDDRWYCIRRLNWSVNKNNPRLYVGIGQSSEENMQVCSHCGHILPFDHFNKAKHNKNGIGRACKTCRRVGRESAPGSVRVTIVPTHDDQCAHNQIDLLEVEA